MALRSVKSRVGQRGDLMVCLFELHAHRRASKSTDHTFRDGSRTSDLGDDGRVHFCNVKMMKKRIKCLIRARIYMKSLALWLHVKQHVLFPNHQAQSRTKQIELM